MASQVLVLQLLFMLSSASARDNLPYGLYGASMTFNPIKQNSDKSYEVVFRNKETHYNCYQNGATCSSGNCGSVSQNITGTIARNSYGFNWCQSEVVTKRKIPRNLPLEISYPTYHNMSLGHGYWISNNRSSMTDCRMKLHVDLGTRSDTRQFNRPPAVAVLPILRVTWNCPRSFNLTVYDPDGDRFRCRVPTNRDAYECSFCRLPKGFILNKYSCSLTYNFSSHSGFHPIELMVEDFPFRDTIVYYSDGSHTSKCHLYLRKRRQATTTTTAPVTTGRPYLGTISSFSQTPVQFSVYVDSHNADSCLDGDYFPSFLAPTPCNGKHIPAFVNRPIEIKVRSRAQYATIYDLLVTGPYGISKQKISTEEYTIKWTPADSDVKDHLPICFVSEAKDKSSRVYHSELRCVIIDVAYQEAVVTCNDKTMRVEVDKSYLLGRNEDNLHLNDNRIPACKLSTLSNSTHLVAVIPLTSCGTKIEVTEDNLIFKNKITSADQDEIITREHTVDISFSCVYSKRNNVALGFKHKNLYTFTEEAFGTVTYQFEFFESQRFKRQVDAAPYPVEVCLNNMMYMQIKATASVPNTELFVESCKASPEDNPSLTYPIIENGCVKDKTVEIYPSSKSQFRYGMEAFEFISDHDKVYIVCSVILCQTGVSGTRCSRGCIHSGENRTKREAAAESRHHSISQGPLVIKKPDSMVVDSSLSLSLNVVFLVGCLLAVAVVVYQSRRSRDKPQPLLISNERI